MLFNFLSADKQKSLTQERLRKALKENAGTYHITKNGRVIINYNHPTIRSRLETVFASLAKIKTKKDR